MQVSSHNINNNNSLRCEDASYEYADNFAYLGTLITTKNKVGKEIQTRIMKENRCAAALNSNPSEKILCIYQNFHPILCLAKRWDKRI